MRIAAVAAYCSIVVMATCASSASMAWAAPSDSCPVGKGRDYSAPLGALPPTRAVPEERPLPFGPRQLRIESLTNVLVGGGAGGFRLEAANSSQHKYRLGWAVELRVTRVSRRGSELQEYRIRRYRLDQPQALGLESVEFTASVPPKPAIYRFDLVIRSAGGKTLGRYGEYYRVVRPSIGAKLLIGARCSAHGPTGRA